MREIEKDRTDLRVVAGLAFAALLVAAVPAQDHAGFARDAVAGFARESTREQQRIGAAVIELGAVIEGEHFEAVREVIAAAAAHGVSPPAKQRSSRAKKRKKAGAAGWTLPTTVSYAFGHDALESRRGSASVVARIERSVPVELALLGLLPGTDRAVAELERRLDSDRSADEFARFLASWRNGDESFYDALDRTAGTADGVFFYDVMLGDFVEEVADTKDDAAKALRRSHDAAHDALHRAFLAYRQYRAFREAVALALVLPPDVPLPDRLRRYDEKNGGAYSLREQVLMVLGVHDYDPAAVVRLVCDTAEPLPAPLWSAPYDPFLAWREVFEGAMPAMIEAAGHTDRWLVEVRKARLAQAATVREAACDAVGVAPLAAGY
ncbi:MAG: hypothetical protein KDE27_10970 [Planctomycetes bacterium]|nr:hypothetical protein [Planctomycetota bacterium]